MRLLVLSMLVVTTLGNQSYAVSPRGLDAVLALAPSLKPVLRPRDPGPGGDEKSKESRADDEEKDDPALAVKPGPHQHKVSPSHQRGHGDDQKPDSKPQGQDVLKASSSRTSQDPTRPSVSRPRKPPTHPFISAFLPRPRGDDQRQQPMPQSHGVPLSHSAHTLQDPTQHRGPQPNVFPSAFGPQAQHEQQSGGKDLGLTQVLALEPRPGPSPRPEAHERFTSHVPFADPKALTNAEWRRWRKQPRAEDAEIRWWARLAEHQRQAALLEPANRARLRAAFRAYHLCGEVFNRRHEMLFPDSFRYLEEKLEAAERAASRPQLAHQEPRPGAHRQPQQDESEEPPRRPGRRPEHSM